MRLKALKLLPFFLSAALLVSCSPKAETDIIATSVVENNSSDNNSFVDNTSTDNTSIDKFSTNNSSIHNSSDENKEKHKTDLKVKSNTIDTRDDINAIIQSSNLVEYEPEDYYTDWINQNPDYIKLNGTSADLSGKGVKIKGKTITITTAGIYVISGQWAEGQIIVNLNNGGMVQLVLNGAVLNSTKHVPVYLKKADKAVISLEDGTNNIVSEGENYTLSSSKVKKNAAIYSNADLTINGTGSLTVNAGKNNGIISRGTLKITSGNITINSSENGITGSDMIAANGGTINIKTGGNGMISTNTQDASKGFIVLDGGNYTITAGAVGIQADNTLLITGGEFNINSNIGNINKKSKRSFLNWAMNNDSVSHISAESNSDGLKAASNLTINGGAFTIDSYGNALTSNDQLSINDGSLLLSSRRTGIHADTSVNITNGLVDIKHSRAGMESSEITVLDGNIHITAEEDGIKLTDKNNSEGTLSTTDKTTPSDNYLAIDGGQLYIDAAKNGMNENGSMFMTNGTVIVNGPIDNTSVNLNNYGINNISGGLLIVTGSSKMAFAPSNKSTQYSIAYNFPLIQKAEQLFHLEDSKGNSILTYAPNKEYQSIIISSPDLKQNETYLADLNGLSSGSETDGLYSDGKYKGGTKLLRFTLTNLITWLPDSGISIDSNDK